MRIRLTSIFTVLPLMLLPVSWSADIAKGQVAYDSGDYQTAIAEWQPLAEAGQAAGQFGMGLIYANGFGVALDDAQALPLVSAGCRAKACGCAVQHCCHVREWLGRPAKRCGSVQMVQPGRRPGNHVGSDRSSQDVLGWPRRRSGQCTGAQMVQHCIRTGRLQRRVQARRTRRKNASGRNCRIRIACEDMDGALRNPASQPVSNFGEDRLHQREQTGGQ